MSIWTPAFLNRPTRVSAEFSDVGKNHGAVHKFDAGAGTNNSLDASSFHFCILPLPKLEGKLDWPVLPSWVRSTTAAS
jgi:hypothetical protein